MVFGCESASPFGIVWAGYGIVSFDRLFCSQQAFTLLFSQYYYNERHPSPVGILQENLSFRNSIPGRYEKSC